MSELAADAILVVHFAFVAFVVGGLGAIWLGAASGWRWRCGCILSGQIINWRR